MRYSLVRTRAAVCAVVLLALAGVPAAASAATPSIVGSVSDSVNLSGIRSVAVSGHYAYSPSYFNGELTAIDISNPAAPKITGESASSTAVYNADFVTVSGGYAYVTSKNANADSTNDDNGTGNSLSIFDVHTNPAQPVLVGSISDATAGDTHLFGAYGVAVSGHYAFVTAQSTVGGQPTGPTTGGNDLVVIDISNPASPTEVGHLDNPTSGAFAGGLQHADAVTVSGNFAYVTATYGHALGVIDISTPTSPRFAGILADATNLANPNDVAVSGNFAYVANQSTPTGALDVVDVSNPAAPHLAAALTDAKLANAYRVELRGSDAYVAADAANSISAIDISNPLAPKIVASVIDGSHLNHTTGLDFALSGRYVIASSPLLSTETQRDFPTYPAPYPVGFGGGGTSPNTGTISAIDMDPNPVSVSLSGPTNGATYQKGQSVRATYSCTAGGFVPIASCTGPVASGGAINTATAGSHTFTVVGVDQDGQFGIASVTYTVKAPVVPPAPSLSKIAQKHKRWREHGKAAKHKPPVGTVFTFKLNVQSKVTFTFTQTVKGRKSGSRCVAQTRKNRHHRSCKLTVVRGKLTFTGKAGVNRIKFSGKIKGKFLKPGTYTLVVTATANGKTARRTITFTIVS